MAVLGRNKPLSCKSGAVPCSDGSRCIPKAFRCDGIFDCGNGEDEVGSGVGGENCDVGCVWVRGK